MTLHISTSVQLKIAAKVPPVTREEIIECFGNSKGVYLLDTRAHNQTTPPTVWFIAETNFGRKLKIVFIQDGPRVIIKTAYDPNQVELRLFAKLS